MGSPPQAKRVCRRLLEEAKAFALEFAAGPQEVVKGKSFGTPKGFAAGIVRPPPP